MEQIGIDNAESSSKSRKHKRAKLISVSTQEEAPSSSRNQSEGNSVSKKRHIVSKKKGQGEIISKGSEPGREPRIGFRDISKGSSSVESVNSGGSSISVTESTTSEVTPAASSAKQSRSSVVLRNRVSKKQDYLEGSSTTVSQSSSAFKTASSSSNPEDLSTTLKAQGSVSQKRKYNQGGAAHKRVKQDTTTGSCASTSRRTSRPGKLQMANQDGKKSNPGSSDVPGPSNQDPSQGANNDGEGRSSTPSPISEAMSILKRSVAEPDESEMNRLQALLETRGFSQHIFGRMHSIHGDISNPTIASQVQQMLADMHATGDEKRQLEATDRMASFVLHNNEESLPAFPVRQVVIAVNHLLSKEEEENFLIMIAACRVLKSLMDALPRSVTLIAEAIPVLLQRLESILCLDVAEHALVVLEMLSRRHARAILNLNGVAACLTHLEYLSNESKRAALSIVAQCCQHLNPDDFNMLRECFPILADYLSLEDQKCVDNICLALCRIAEAFQSNREQLREIAGKSLLTNLQHLLMSSPPMFSSSTFVLIIRIYSVICSQCQDIALKVLKNNFADTLLYLLRGSPEAAHSIASTSNKELSLMSRSSAELFDIVSLVSELLPKLPRDNIFSVNSLLIGQLSSSQSVQWCWKDEKGQWKPYKLPDSRVIEASYQEGEDGIRFTQGSERHYIDFKAMERRIDLGRKSTQVLRKTSGVDNADQSSTADGNQEQYLKNDPETLKKTIITLFGPLMDIYASSADCDVKHKCLSVIVKMVFFSPPELLMSFLKPPDMSGQIATMLSTNNINITVPALQLACILLEKLPREFRIHYRREGVIYQMEKLTESSKAAIPVVDQGASENNSVNATNASNSNTSAGPSVLKLCGSSDDEDESVTTYVSWSKEQGKGMTSNEIDQTIPPKEKKQRVRLTARTSTGGRRKTPQPTVSGKKYLQKQKDKLVANFFVGLGGRGGKNDEGASSKKAGPPLEPDTNEYNQMKINEWVLETAKNFLAKYSSLVTRSVDMGEQSGFNLLIMASRNLVSDSKNGQYHLFVIKSVLFEKDISSFEILHSGLIKSLTTYLTEGDNKDIRSERIRIFLGVFLEMPIDELQVQQPITGDGLVLLVQKLIGCINQTENFPIWLKSLTVGGARSITSILKLFNNRLIKCILVRTTSCVPWPKKLRNFKDIQIKADPLQPMKCIERYLIDEFAQSRNKNGGDSEEEFSEEEVDVVLHPSLTSFQNHHIEFLIDGKIVPDNVTVIQAIRELSSAVNSEPENESPTGNSTLWSISHTIHYRLVANSEVDGSPAKGASSISRKGKGPGKLSRLKASFPEVPEPKSPLERYLDTNARDRVNIADETLNTLVLLNVLYGINRYWGSVYYLAGYQPIIPITEFHSKKLAAKASRQLQDPVIIMTGNVPVWLCQICWTFPFILTFETKQLFFYATSNDRERFLHKLIEASPELNNSADKDNFLPRLNKVKKTVSRENILPQAEEVFKQTVGIREVLEITYEDEYGVGLGPTMEFYSLVSNELQRPDLNLWRQPSTGDGLYPVPLSPHSSATSDVRKVVSSFRLMGMFLAKALMDSRLVDLPLNPLMFAWLLGKETTLSSSELKLIDPVFAASYQSMASILREKKSSERDLNVELSPSNDSVISDMGLDFTVPGTDIEMKRNGQNIPVVMQNLEEYLKSIPHWILIEGVRRQMEAFKEGFESVCQSKSLRLFEIEELELLLCGSDQKDYEESWNPKTLLECWKPCHGYTSDSRVVKDLAEVMSEFTRAEKRKFLQFVTGTPRLPIGGFKKLSPLLTIVKKGEKNKDSDSFLPSVMTCANYLKLPDYTSKEILEAKLKVAMDEGQLSFHLS
ncbi:E3 ubiquitin-protein ligase TRIP12-like [Artemia franciscana]|uniref:E3 ubiquitin-protein ligase n=1 Tax=Artemia franciscana TaxID=6661 RepID=A0AA88KXE3_ARTSF|nr:hypothetical protein QYM36_015487 [Artemia franciscana]KAK2707817.1 hypothetical protein QYM36_015487 [Artemia franciscana]